MNSYFMQGQYTHIMLDLETLGLEPGCKIISIGAATFSAESPAEGTVQQLLYKQIHRAKKQEQFHELASTVAWWNKQSQKARDLAFSGTTPIDEALLDLSAWVKTLPGTPVVWGNGAMFDIAIINKAYELLKLDKPWTYRNEMCFRTLKSLFSVHTPEPKFIGARHSALADAAHQAQWAQMIVRKL